MKTIKEKFEEVSAELDRMEAEGYSVDDGKYSKEYEDLLKKGDDLYRKLQEDEFEIFVATSSTKGELKNVGGTFTREVANAQAKSMWNRRVVFEIRDLSGKNVTFELEWNK